MYQFALQEGKNLKPEDFAIDLSPPRKKKKQHRSWSKQLRKIQSNKENSKNHDSNYTPCTHPPSEKCDSSCPCVETQNFCEKFCRCSPDCTYRCERAEKQQWRREFPQNLHKFCSSFILPMIFLNISLTISKEYSNCPPNFPRNFLT